MTGPAETEIGSEAALNIDMFIHLPSTHVVVDVFVPVNSSDVISIVNMTVVDTGEYFPCLHKDEFQCVLHLAENGLTNDRGTLDLGTVTNTGMLHFDVNQYGRVS